MATLETSTCSEGRTEVYGHLHLHHGQIRILILHPSTDMEAPLIGELIKARLEDLPEYEALSYVWGTELSSEPLHLLPPIGESRFSTLQIQMGQDQNPTVKLKIMKSVEVALRYLRRKDTPRRLWIDAVCIHQANTKERSHQVQQMTKIYASASQVLVWLGEGFEGCDVAFEAFDLYCKGDEYWDAAGSTVPFSVAYQRFMDLRWWKRVWVFQEFLLSKKPPLIGCGSHWVDSETLEDLELIISYQADRVAMQSREDAEEYRDAYAYHAGYMGKCRWRLKAGLSLSHLIEPPMASEATDDRDHIYGLMGILKPCYQQYVAIDYNLTASKVFQMATSAAIIGEKFLQILHHLTNGRSDLPSWTVDFSKWKLSTANKRTPPGIFTFESNATSLKHGDASGQHGCSEAQYDSTKGILQVHGVALGALESVVPRTTTHADPDTAKHRSKKRSSILKEFCYNLRPVIAQLPHILQRRFSSSQAQSAIDTGMIWKTAIAWPPDRQSERELPFNFADLQTTWNQRHDFVQHDDADARSKLPGNEIGKVGSYLRYILKPGFNNTAWFISDSGHFGIGAADSQPGDLICLFFGASYPAILRPSSDGHTFRIVSFAYVDGIMHGELESQGMEIRSFNLS